MRYLLRHVPLAIRSLSRQPAHAFAVLVLFARKWAKGKGAESGLYKAIDFCHRERSATIASNQACISRTIANLSLTQDEVTTKHAILFLIRGQLALHNTHQLHIAKCLQELGYSTSFVVCGGGVEQCGIGQTREPLDLPPVACHGCRQALQPLVNSTLPVTILKRVDNEDTKGPIGRDLNLEEVEQLIYPSLLRYFQGDLKQVRARTATRKSFERSLNRYAARVESLLSETEPKLVVLFNGLFFPESVIGAVAKKKGIRILYHERGVRPNSLFLSVDVPACHYRAERLWKKLENCISELDCERARRFVVQRRTKNIDPLGEVRNLNHDGQASKTLGLAAKSYVVFFAPVIHDTASVYKNNGLGESYQAMETLCRVSQKLNLNLVIRAHPDELRQHNPSRFPLRRLLDELGLLSFPNITLLDSTEHWNPYQLAENASHVVIYNGTLAMECAVLGIPVVNLADSHYSAKGFTNDAHSEEELSRLLQYELPNLTSEAIKRAEKYLYFYLYKSTLSVDQLVNERAGFLCEAVHNDQSQQQRSELLNHLSLLLAAD